MKEQKVQVQVTIMVENFFARKFISSMVARDARLGVLDETGTPQDLVLKLTPPKDKKQKFVLPEIILLDTDYNGDLPLGTLIHDIHALAPLSIIVCISQQCKPETVRDVVISGARGLLLNDEIQMELASALVLAQDYDFIMTKGVENRLRGKVLPLPRNSRSLPTWRPDPQLDRRHLIAIWLHIVFGMSAASTGNEVGLRKSSINKYVTEARFILESGWLDYDLISPDDLDFVSIKDQTYILFTQIPEES